MHIVQVLVEMTTKNSFESVFKGCDVKFKLLNIRKTNNATLIGCMNYTEFNCYANGESLGLRVRE